MPDRVIAGMGFIYRVADGVLVSRASVVTDPLPAGLGIFTRGSDLGPNERWDEKRRQPVPWTDPDRVAALNAERAAIAARITALGGVPA